MVRSCLLPARLVFPLAWFFFLQLHISTGARLGHSLTFRNTRAVCVCTIYACKNTQMEKLSPSLNL